MAAFRTQRLPGYVRTCGPFPGLVLPFPAGPRGAEGETRHPGGHRTHRHPERLQVVRGQSFLLGMESHTLPNTWVSSPPQAGGPKPEDPSLKAAE